MRFMLILLLMTSSFLFSLVYSPRIKVNDQVDMYSLETILQGIIKPGMTDREKAEAVWRFIVANNYHYKAPIEGIPENSPQVVFELNTLEDPLKLFNVYGYTYCFSNICLTTKLWDAAGLDSTRTWGIFGHLISEVYYDSAWHYYDGDQSVSSYFLKEDGKTVASVRELEDKADIYIMNPKFKSNPQMPFDANPFYEHESRKVLADFFTTKNDNYIRDRTGVTVHRMDYYLRRCETLTLFFDPQGRWRHVGMDVPTVNPARGPYDVHSDRTYGNGLFEYRPDLKDSSILSEGLHSSRNLRCNGTLALSDPALPGEAVIKVVSPWVIAGTPLSPSFAPALYEKYAGAAVFSGHLDTQKPGMTNPAELEVQISTDKMLGAWQTVYKQSNTGYFTLDLSEWLSRATYYYSVKLILKKSGAKNAEAPFLDSLALKTWVQVNPASLPRLVSGENRISYSAEGPEVDKIDIERGSIPDRSVDYLFASSNLNVNLKDSKKRFIQQDTAKPGSVTFELKSPEGPLADYYGVFLFVMRENMHSSIEWSENDTLHYKKLPKPEKLYQDHWADWYSQNFTAGPNVSKAYFRVTLTGGAALTLFTSGYRYHYKPSSGRISVVQAAAVDGKMKEFAWDMKDPKGTTVVKVLGKNVVNKYLKYICK